MEIWSSKCLIHTRPNQVTKSKIRKKLTIFSLDPGRDYLGIRISRRKITRHGPYVRLLYMSSLKMSWKTRGLSTYYADIIALFNSDEILPHLVKCDLFLIEGQMIRNADCLRDSQAFITTLMMMDSLKDSSIIAEVPSRMKGAPFDNPPKTKNGKNATGERYKKWLLGIALRICDESLDINSTKIIESAVEEYENRDKSKKLSLQDVIKPYEFSDLITLEESYIRSVPALSEFIIDI
jgi:hypothetical protein